MGATACGKTELSLSLAESLNAEIISVDSALVYRGLDIGTAKPSAGELAVVPHHLIDVCDPWETYSVARFSQDACRLIGEIQVRGKRPLLVGGTMLYFKALADGLADMPEADAQMRQSMMNEAATRGWQAMHADLAQADPEAAKRIHPNDPQRIQRALEVFRLTGTPMSVLQQETRSPLAQMPIKFALAPQDRSWLHERIKRRFDIMIDQGFLDEVRLLKQDVRIHADLPAMRSVGYRQALEYINTINDNATANDAAAVSKPDDSTWVEKAIAATRQLAKRQLTWMRGMDDVHIMTCDTLSVEEQHSTLCATLIKNENVKA